jgi:hypothetical protein
MIVPLLPAMQALSHPTRVIPEAERGQFPGPFPFFDSDGKLIG